jgi:UDP-glucose 4-epimerase
MKALVTGGAGFIGSHVADQLLAAGLEVVVLDDLSSGHVEQVPAAAGFYQLDLQSPWLGPLLQQERPDVIFHHAAQISVRRSVENPAHDAAVNILGTLSLLEEAVRSGVKQVIFASTGGAIYGEADVIPTPEDYPARPVSPYGVSKLSVEHYLHYYFVQHRLPYTALRYSNVYGPRQDPHGEAGVVAIFAERLLGGKPGIINGDGLQTRDYVYVEDVAAANLCALQAEGAGTVNVGTGVETSVVDLLAAMRRLSQSPSPQEHGPARPGEQRRSCIAIGRAARELGWQPRVGLDEGLRRTLDYFRARPGPARPQRAGVKTPA